MVEKRVQVAERRFRIPDVCVVLGRGPHPAIYDEPPFICIEILSKKDTPVGTRERIDDYLNFGVRYVWVIDPRKRRAWVYAADGSREVKDGVLRTENPALSVDLGEVFAGLES